MISWIALLASGGVIFFASIFETAKPSAEALQKDYATQSGLPPRWTSPSGMEFALIPPGSFVMGLPGSKDAFQHKVTLTDPFYMAVREMTKGQWIGITGKIHSNYFPGAETPINCVTQVQAAQMLTILEKEIPGARLPTEAEWEYAARAGNTNELVDDLHAKAWSAENSDNEIKPTAKKSPNDFGLYDTLGNVWEWCGDYYDADYYRRSPNKNPNGPEKSLYKYFVLRGGSAWSGIEACRYGNRAFSQASRTRPDIGLRLAFTPTDAFRKRHLSNAGVPSTTP
jgi:formylglycine-generating enzyme required for sulfatase activity